MRIETISCPECGTVVAANVLESHRVMKCPGVECETILRFSQLPVDVQEHYSEHRDKYRID